MKLLGLAGSSLLLSLINFAMGNSYNDKVIVGYYAPWGNTSIEAIPFNKLTHINYAFGVVIDKAEPNKITLDSKVDVPNLLKLSSLAHKNNVKVLLSIGGWTGSQTFSLMVKDSDLRQKFIDQAIGFLKEGEGEGRFNLDGLDLDWEYPGRQGAPCNAVDKMDSENYLLLLDELRTKMDSQFKSPKKLLTAAVRTLPFDNRDGEPLRDVSKFAQYFDFVNLMLYDIMGSWSDTTGPNAPYKETPNGKVPISYTSGIQAWLNAGFPARKMTAGLAFYGRSATTKIDMGTDPANQFVPKVDAVPHGDEEDSDEPNKMCDEGPGYSGEWKYKNLRKSIITDSYSKASNGYTRYWDNTTLTPYLFNNKTFNYITYDDPESLKLKLGFAKLLNLKGLMIWDLSMDYNNELIDAIQPILSSTSLSHISSNVGSVSYNAKYTYAPVSFAGAGFFNNDDEVTVTRTVTQYPTSSTSSKEPHTKTVTVTVGPTPTFYPPPPLNRCIPGTARCVSPGLSPLMLQCTGDGVNWMYLTCTLGSVCLQTTQLVYCSFY